LTVPPTIPEAGDHPAAARQEFSRFNPGVLDALTAHICVLDAAGRIVAVNRAWREFAAANPPLATNVDLGADCFAVCAAAIGEDAATAREALRGLRAVARGDLPEFVLEYPCHSPTTQRWFELRATRTEDAGPGCLVVAHTNITPRKEADALLTASELRYRRLFESAKDGILILDAETGVVVDVNPFLIQLLDLSREQFLGKKIWELGFFRDIVANYANFVELQREEYIRYEDRPLKTAAGRRIDVEFVSNVYRVNHHKVIQCNIRDITERKQAEAALQESERRLNEAQKLAQLGRWIWDVKTGNVEWSEEVYQIFQLDPKQFTPQINSILALSPWPEDHERDQELIRRAVASHEKGTYDQRFLRPDGSIGYYHSTFQGNYDGAGHLVSIFGTIQDITAREQSAAAMRLAHERLRCFVDANIVGVLIANAAGDVIEANDYYLRLIGFTRAELQQGQVDWRSITPPEWLPADEQALCEMREHGTCTPYEKEYLRRDGTRVPVLLADAMLPGPGNQIAAFALDITARKEAEAQLRKLARAVEQSPVSIVITDRGGNIEFVNPRFTLVTGYTFAEVLGKNPRVLKSGETPAEEYQQLWETITAGKDWRGEFHNKRKDGTLYWETASISPIRDASGAITHFIAVKEDMTEKKLTDAKLLRAQRVESIGSLASGIAHDLNNILTPIVMCAPMLQLEDTPKNRRELAQTIESSAHRAVGIVKQLLSFARGKEGQKATLQVRHLVREMAKIAREVFPRSIQVQEACDTDLWPVLADATQLHQVLLNLCVNARDAMPSGGKLTLRADNVTLDEHYVAMHKEAVPGPFVRIRVEDTGTGIPDAVRARIFESFFTTKGEDLGTGLGLTTVLGIVRDHKGFITFTTVPGQGTTFEIHLPAVLEAQTLAETAPAPEAIPRGHGELVLVVDDEPAIQDTTRRTLERYGYAVLQAHDGIEALAQFSAHPAEIRAVVTDFIMPLMDGVTLCRTLRVLAPRTPLLVSSGGLFGTPGGEALRAFEELGIGHILHKPHNAEVLLQALSEVLLPSQTPASGKGAA
jgi:two-component system, cell cycle sensor histidine kinase and response regulator CckA